MNAAKRAAQLVCACCCITLAIFSAKGSETSMTALPAATQRILSSIEQWTPKRTGADRRAAESLDRDGQRAYRKGDYDAAWTAFSNSYPNFPTAFSYIMTGDSHWRAVLDFAKKKAASKAGSAGVQTCGMSNERFPHDLLMDLDSHHEVGLALAAKANAGTLPSEPFFQRAQATATCLRHLAGRYAAQPRTACVETDALADGLGAPLPMAGEAP